MKCIFLLSGGYNGLAKEEILSLFDVKNHKLINRLLIADLKENADTFKRLALTKGIYRLLFECKISNLAGMMKKYDWSSVYKDNFCLRIHNLSNTIKKISNKTRTTSESKGYRSNPFVLPSEKDLAKYVWHSVKNPKVDLENPKTKIELFVVDDNVYCSLLIFQNNEDFESRKSHLRPFPSPSSLHPRFARALVNITGIKEKEILLEPFCGAGGFLVEAGLMEIKCIGYDINKIMINGCIKNLKHYKISNYKIKNKNALEIDDKFDYAATDLPYGLNSNVILEYENNQKLKIFGAQKIQRIFSGDWKRQRINKKIQQKDFIENLENFYLKFLKNLRKKLKKKAVIIFPGYVDHKRLLKKSNFKIEKEFSNYVHRSLSRKIVKIS